VVAIHGAIFTRWESFRDIAGAIGLPVENPPGLPIEDEQEAATSPISGYIGRYSLFEGGVIYWVRDEDRISVIGFEQPGAKAIADKYHVEGGSGGDLGFPTSDDYCWDEGVRVNFENGYIHWTQANGAVKYMAKPALPENPIGRGAPTEEIKNQFIACYDRNGGEAVLSDPTADVYNLNGYWAQDFSDFASIIVYNFLLNYAYLIKEPILSKYSVRMTDLGPPVGDQGMGDFSQPTQQVTRCKYQNFENGAVEVFENGVYQGQAFVILNPFFQKWADLGYANHDLGYPIEDHSEELISYFGRRFKYQNFEGGALEHLINLGKVVEIHGAIFTKWKNLNYAQSHLGLPIEDEKEAARSPVSGFTGRYSVFERGIIHWVRNEDRMSVIGFEQPGAKAIADKYHVEGGSGGDLGFPTSGDYCWNGGVRVDFENGYIHWTQAGGAVKYTEEPSLPIVYNFNLLNELDFETKFEGWEFTNNGRTATIYDSFDIAIQQDNTSSSICLIINPGLDPQLKSPNLNISSASYNTVVFEMKSEADVCLGNLFYRSYRDNVIFDFHENPRTDLNVINDGAFHTYTINLGNSVNWQGEIIKIRIDPVGEGNKDAGGDVRYGENDNVYINYIKLIKQ